MAISNDLPSLADSSQFGSTVANQNMLTGMRSGDADAFARFVHGYGPQLRAAIRRRLSPLMRARYDSQDLAQSVYATLYRRRLQMPQFDKIQRLVAYVAQIAANKVTDAYRARHAAGRDPTLERPLMDSQGVINSGLVSQEPSPSEVFVREEEREALFAGISEQHAQILTLKLSGATDAEMAAAVNLSERQIRRIIREIGDKAIKRYEAE